MSFERDGLLWEGAFPSKERLEHRAGVYVIWCQGSVWTILDVGEAEDVKARIDNHDREPCWNRNCSGAVHYAVHYTSAGPEARRKIESLLRAKYDPPCGER